MDQRKNQNYHEMNASENTMYQNLKNAAKSVLRGKFVMVTANIKKQILNKQYNFTT
jgi:hypothetical protein